MSFNIVLQRNKSERVKLDKSLDDIMTLTGVFRDRTELENPVILVEANLADFATANYLTISNLRRSYFIEKRESVRKGLFALHCHVDVLSSFADEIRDNKAIIRRSQKDYELDFDDGSIKTFNNPKIQTKSFPSGFTTSLEFVLAVAGGAGSSSTT